MFCSCSSYFFSLFKSPIHVYASKWPFLFLLHFLLPPYWLYHSIITKYSSKQLHLSFHWVKLSTVCNNSFQCRFFSFFFLRFRNLFNKATFSILWFNKWNWKRNDLLMPIIERHCCCHCCWCSCSATICMNSGFKEASGQSETGKKSDFPAFASVLVPLHTINSPNHLCKIPMQQYKNTTAKRRRRK